jgi:hypothetical protein
MKETGINNSGSLIADVQPTERLNPGVGSFNNPAMSVTSQMPSILMGGSAVVLASGNDRLNPSTRQAFSNRVAVVPSVGDQSIGTTSRSTRFVGATDFDCFERDVEELRFRRGRRVHMKSERSTLAINQYHKLRSFPAFCLAHFEPPFFAEANVPSTKHSSQRIISFSSSWAKKARQSFSNVPSLAHFCKRRWMVLDGPYRRGSSLQGEPVQRIHKIPSKQPRSSNGGRPPLRSFFRQGRFRSGSSALTFSHCRSVNFLHANFHVPPLEYDLTRHGGNINNHPGFREKVSG